MLYVRIFTYTFVGVDIYVYIYCCSAVASTKFLNRGCPVQERLKELPVEIVEAAKIVKELGLSRHGLDVVHNYVDFHIQLAFSQIKTDSEAEKLNIDYKKRLPSLKTVMRQMHSTCDREQDGDVRVAKFVVPEGYKNAGLYENEKEFKWTCIITTIVEVLWV